MKPTPEGKLFFQKNPPKKWLELAKKYNNKDLIVDLIVKEKGYQELSEKLFLEEEYEKYSELFLSLINDVGKAIEVQQDYKFFLLERICFQKKRITSNTPSGRSVSPILLRS